LRCPLVKPLIEHLGEYRSKMNCAIYCTNSFLPIAASLLSRNTNACASIDDCLCPLDCGRVLGYHRLDRGHDFLFAWQHKIF
jgi:hypothetical protein